MDAKYCRDRAETCLRLAKELSWNNPGRFQLMDIAEKFQRRATSLEAQRARTSARRSLLNGDAKTAAADRRTCGVGRS